VKRVKFSTTLTSVGSIQFSRLSPPHFTTVAISDGAGSQSMHIQLLASDKTNNADNGN